MPRRFFDRGTLTPSPPLNARSFARQRAFVASSVSWLHHLYGTRCNRRDFPLRQAMLDAGKSTEITDLGTRTLGTTDKSGNIGLHSKLPVDRLQRRRTQAIAVHEVVHSLQHDHNDLATAHAFESYIRLLPLSRARRIERFPSLSANRKDRIQFAFTREWSPRIAKALATLEYSPTVTYRNVSFARAGYRLGLLAVQAEAYYEKPGLGLFFIREISMGKSIDQTLEKLRQGTFEAERKQLLKTDPALRRLIQTVPLHGNNGVNRLRGRPSKFGR